MEPNKLAQEAHDLYGDPRVPTIPRATQYAQNLTATYPALSQQGLVAPSKANEPQEKDVKPIRLYVGT